ncbi:MAG TPA: TA system VapC family ribonuclease toxin [Anaeromyxobacter sp.]|nr:TA system VapC family ribonuclease toxin [Anaeromyxobacter sp.]
MFVVDTNVLVYAARADSPFHAPCRAALERWRAQEGAWFTTWNVVYEFLSTMTYRASTPVPWTLAGAWSFIEALLASPGFKILSPTSRHAAVAAEVFRALPDLAGKRLHDAHIAILMREHGVRRIYTRDTDFFRFPFLEPVDPVRPAAPGGAAEPVARYRGGRGRRSVRARR